jgi:2-polyprenyl-6-methoxyphenol hydroxylase-like FAD-dependent oxidoreductase
MAGAAGLAEALGATPSDPHAALLNYEREHRQRIDPRTRGVGLASHFLIPTTSAGIAIRNLAIRLWSLAKPGART